MAEQLYSFEEALRITQDSFYADMAEFIFSMLSPRHFYAGYDRPSICAAANQIAADRKARQFFDTNKEANIFGIAPNFGAAPPICIKVFPNLPKTLFTMTAKTLFPSLFPLRNNNRLPWTKYPYQRNNAISFEATRYCLK